MYSLTERCFYRIQVSMGVERTTSNALEARDSNAKIEDIQNIAAKSEDWKLYIGPEMGSLGVNHF